MSESWKAIATTMGLVVITLIVLHFVAPASLKSYTGTT
jgi:hypothetical protein